MKQRHKKVEMVTYLQDRERLPAILDRAVCEMTKGQAGIRWNREVEKVDEILSIGGGAGYKSET